MASHNADRGDLMAAVDAADPCGFAELRARALHDRNLSCRACHGDRKAMRELHFGAGAWRELATMEIAFFVVAGLELHRINSRRVPAVAC